MNPEKLTVIKKELAMLSSIQLTDICLRLAKYKKENKELLNYLLFDANDSLNYAEKIKEFLEEDFKSIRSSHGYYNVKALRKILRILNRNIKYTASKQIEVELLLWFCKNFLIYADTRSNNKALRVILIRQIEKIKAALPKLHEDLQFDYNQEFETIINTAHQKVRDFNKSYYAK